MLMKYPNTVINYTMAIVGSKINQNAISVVIKFDHIAKDCNSKVNQLVHHAKHVEEEASMFYACHAAEVMMNKSSV